MMLRPQDRGKSKPFVIRFDKYCYDRNMSQFCCKANSNSPCFTRSSGNRFKKRKLTPFQIRSDDTSNVFAERGEERDMLSRYNITVNRNLFLDLVCRPKAFYVREGYMKNFTTTFMDSGYQRFKIMLFCWEILELEKVGFRSTL